MLRSCNIVTLVLLHCRGVPGTGHCCTGALAAGKHADDEVDDDDGDVDDDDDDEEDVDDVDDDDDAWGGLLRMQSKASRCSKSICFWAARRTSNALCSVCHQDKDDEDIHSIILCQKNYRGGLGGRQHCGLIIHEYS